MSNLEANNFSGGITDNFISAQPRMMKEADNFFINQSGFLFTRPAYKLYDRDAARFPSLSFSSKMFLINKKLCAISDFGLYQYDSTTGINEVFGPTSSRALDKYTTSQRTSVAYWNKHHFITTTDLPEPIFAYDDMGDIKTQATSLPQPSSDPTLTYSAGTNNWVYLIHYKTTYTIDGVTFETVSPVRDLIAAPSASLPVDLTDIPQLPSGGSYNYNTADTKIVIYRTKNAIGGTYHKVTEVNHGTTSYTDNTADGSLPDLEAINPAVSDLSTPTPKCKYIAVANDILWMACPETNGVVEKSKLRHSIRFKPYNCPGDFEEDFEDEITGITSLNVYPIVFTKDKTFRIEGFYNEDGSGFIQKRRISDTVGCISNDSIVQTERGVYFAAESGFYFTDGNQVVRVSNHLNIRYRNIVKTDQQKGLISGAYDKENNLVLWTVQESQAVAYPTKIYVCYIDKQAEGASSHAFTTWSGGKVNPNNFKPYSLVFFDNKVLASDYDGYLLAFDYEKAEDDEIRVGQAINTWEESAILFNYESPSYNFGVESVRKWVTWLILNVDSSTNLTLQCKTVIDNGTVEKPFKEIIYNSNIAWGDDTVPWGDENIRWKYFKIVSTKRRSPSPNRCSYYQLKMENALTQILDRDLYASVTINSTTKVITFNGIAEIPNSLIGYYFAIDNNSTFYRIVGVENNTITVSDSSDNLPSGNFNGEIIGYKRSDILKLMSYSIVYEANYMSQEPHTES